MGNRIRLAALGICLAGCFAAQARETGVAAATANAVRAEPQQPRLSLEQLVQTVLDNNPELRAVQQSGVTAQAAVLSAGALPNPSWSGAVATTGRVWHRPRPAACKAWVSRFP